MFAKKSTDRPANKSDTPETVRALAAAVPMTAQHQMAENSLEALRRQFDALAAEHSALCHANHQKPDSMLAKKIVSMEPQLSDLRARIVKNRQEITVHRAQRARNVAEMLAPTRRAAAVLILDLLDELDRQTDLLIACNEELRGAGDTEAVFLNQVPCVTLRDHARRLASA
ncbi:hypothetical protein [Bradyrhizobium diazoefficiens]|uniref:hypothetical protein n=1 Tax=Bradyrhizobium diazoefficiens TaxID=1355477 RepID=UPI00272CDCFA|nr:hypothetical protein [Bradyrhizobium diazoefficiens]WLA62374.1 hypothetical protein QNN01_28330 [Bradyrhizobium diazoefficiens]